MPTTDESVQSPLDLDDGLQLLADPHRRRIIDFLRETPRLAFAPALADEFDTDTDIDIADSASDHFYHVHLPKLAAYDVIEWEGDVPGVIQRGPRYDDACALFERIHDYPAAQELRESDSAHA